MKEAFWESPVFHKVHFLFFSIAVFLFFGCSNIISGYVYENGADTEYLYISIDSSKSIMQFNGSRSITAPSIDFSNSAAQNYCYYVWGKSKNSSVSPKKVKFDPSSGTTGTIVLDFPVTTYTFILAVTKTEPDELTSDVILNNAMFIGYTNADLSYSKTVKFALSTNGLTCPGDVYLDFYLDTNSWSDSQVDVLNTNYETKVGIYKTSGGVVKSMNLYPLSKSSAISSANMFISIPAGEYDLTISINEKFGANQIYSYTDKLFVSPNRTINARIDIPNILDFVPAAPENFRAAYCMDYRFYTGSSAVATDNNGSYQTESGLKLTSNADIEKYNFSGYGILFSWIDKSVNETGFRITLADVSKIHDGVHTPEELIAYLQSTEMTDADWDYFWSTTVNYYLGQPSVVKIFEPSSYKSQADYIAGSVEKNKNSLIVYGSFDSCYVAKIEAVNVAGTSSPCYVKLDEDFNVGVYDTDYIGDTAIYAGKAFSTAENPCKFINRYKIVYYLNGGAIEYTYVTEAISKKSEYKIDYKTYGDGVIKYYTAAGSSDGTFDNPALIYRGDNASLDGERWNRWCLGSIEGNVISSVFTNTADGHTYQKPNDYTGYTSLYLFARYD